MISNPTQAIIAIEEVIDRLLHKPESVIGNSPSRDNLLQAKVVFERLLSDYEDKCLQVYERDEHIYYLENPEGT